MITAPTHAPIVPAWQESVQISYLRAGESGPPVVLLHGWWAFKELWWSTLLALAPHYRAYALDLPGHGASPLGRVDSIAALADHIAAFCAAEKLTSITLVGHSMGGGVACELALRHPQLVSRLVLADAAVDAQRLPVYVRSYLKDTMGWAALRLSHLLTQRARPLGQGVPHLHGGGWIRPFLRRSSYMPLCEPDGLRRLLYSLLHNNIGERLAQIRVPTLVVTGQFDALVPPEHSRRIARMIPNARFVVIPHALHNPMDERPAAFERALLAFLHAQ